ncbi:MAG: PEP-CTERM sorting domain-containing protein [Lentimonas sp.]
MNIKSLSILTISSLVLSSAASAVTIFTATTGNTTTVNNNGAGTLTAGGTGLLYAGAAVASNMGGFTSTSDINTLIGGAGLTAADTVTISVTVDSITGNTFRSNGFEFGLSSATSFRPASESLLLGMAGSNSGSDVRFMSAFGSQSGSLNFNSNQAALIDGFTITLTADVNGYSFFIQDILVAGSTNPLYTDGDTTATISGTYRFENEFVDYFGSGHLYTAAQQQTNASSQVTDYTSATIDVVPEPGTYAMLAGLTGLVFIMLRRRKV